MIKTQGIGKPFTLPLPAIQVIIELHNDLIIAYKIINTFVAVQQDGIEIRKTVRKYEEKFWAEKSNLEDLPLVITQMKMKQLKQEN